MLKINVSIAIVCMVNNTALGLQSHSTEHIGKNQSIFSITKSPIEIEANQCPGSVHHKAIDGPFLYDKATQGLILSAYFWGYTATQVSYF
jgi:hypothetical protein